MVESVDLDKLYEVILESAESPIKTCLGELRDGMNELGYELPKRKKGEKQAYVKALESWSEIKKNLIPLDEIHIIEIDDLPSTKIEKDGTEYYIHGIAHIPPSESVNAFFRKCVKEYGENGSCLYEQLMDKVFDIGDIADEIDDHKVYTSMDKYKEKRGKFHDPYPLSESRMASLGLKIALTAMVASQDINYIPLVRESTSRLFLPEPLWIRYLSGDRAGTRTFAKRSKYMTDKMEECGKDYDEVHIITGYSHEPQIEYFLEAE